MLKRLFVSELLGYVIGSVCMCVSYMLTTITVYYTSDNSVYKNELYNCILKYYCANSIHIEYVVIMLGALTDIM